MEIAYLALIISVINTYLVLRDRFPRAHVTIGKEIVTEDTEYGSAPIGERIWVTISNRSAKRLFVTDIHAEWTRYIFYSFRMYRKNLKDLQRWESGDKPDPTTRFWIEPWGDAVLSADAEDFEYEFQQQIFTKWEKISYRVVIIDGLQKKHKSNKIKLHASLRQIREWKKK
jgi:hypothetical protein